MPFRFELELKAKSSRALWTRAIGALHTISDSLKIDIRQGTETGHDEQGRRCYSELVFSSMNKTKTSVMKISFKECFFRMFRIEGEITDNVTRTMTNVENYAKNYSLIINSRDMNTLFKDCADDAESWKIFLIAGNEISQMIYSNRLFVEFETKAGLKKKYSVSYRPSMFGCDSKISFIYLKTLENQRLSDEQEERGVLEDDGFDLLEEEEDERVHRIAINTLILKRFIQVFPQQIEDFRLEIRPKEKSLVLIGYNRQNIIGRGDSVVNKPMNLSIQIQLNQIAYNNVRYTSFIPTQEFQMFIQLISTGFTGFNSDDDNTKSNKRSRTISSYDRGFSNDYEDNICDIIFSKSGYPIIFEKKYFTDGDNEILECCSISLTEVTDGESSRIILEAMNAAVNQKIRDLTSASGHRQSLSALEALPTVKGNIWKQFTNAELAMPLSNRQDDHPVAVKEPLFVPDDDLHAVEYPQDLVVPESVNNDVLSDASHERFHQTRVVEKPGFKKDQIDATVEHDMVHGKNKRRLLTEEEPVGDDGVACQENYLGPTQKLQIKGLFD
ncbi:hypothetical protein CAS74_002360 [Pichia kudriavzevii]|uniref:DNA damage checkpoint protein 1 n=1 Tax=Pichia kudriavzevii TaxID=4909 RepID=A0A1Z8JPV6_PICKU|nr:hypothetical protein CAS74_002360 [Pichia kudriavzevii]